MGAPRERPWGEAALWLLLLGPLFFALYGLSGWVTSRGGSAASLAFGWEAAIPFVPASVVPYMSIDLFFAGSFFLCRNRRDLRAHAARIALAIGVATACFVLFPARMGFERPPVEGLFGPLFGLLETFDTPYNQAPSLHVALLAVLWPVYAGATRKALRLVVHLWIVLIAASVLLTWQHHTLDVATGALLGGALFCLVPDAPLRRARPPVADRRRALPYRVAGLLLVLLAALTGPVGLLLLWPAVALGLVAAAYGRVGPALFGKRAGRLGLAARWVLLPYRLAAWLSVRLFGTRHPAWSEVAPGLLVGRALSNGEARRAIGAGVVAVVDLAAEFDEAPAFRGLPYLGLPVLDLAAPSPKQIRRAVRFIEAQRMNGPVYVHCALGYGRSACVAAAWLVESGESAGPADAMRRIRAARPPVRLGRSQSAALRRWRRPAPRAVTT
ncbi:MAG: phosphatase PAP2/dual specificity phosphatase family protein [Inquilinus sp.]|nr:phosphatase PAP2/dual specificity phosphatase family protein [Inquilinus sp.]